MNIKYIELKTGCSDDGPAWIANVKESKSGKTIYFNDHAFQKCQGIQGNYYDVETGEAYWISSVKRNGQDRHWAGSGKVVIDRKCIDEYLSIVSMAVLPTTGFIIEDIEDSFPVERINRLRSEK